MKIIVCIKQVPDTSEVKLNKETNTLIRDGIPSIINPYDRHALEAALLIRDDVGGRVTVLSMGPPQAENALREAIGLGADEAVLLTDRAFAGSDTLATSRVLSRAIETLSGADLIFCGKQAIDGDTAQVGPEVAEFLGIPHVAYVRKIVSVNDGVIKLERLMDDGYDIIETEMPVLFTAVKELNIPRLPSLRGKMAAKKAQIKRLAATDLGLSEAEMGLKGSPTQVNKVFSPEARAQRKELSGTLEEQVTALASELKKILV